MRAHCLGIDRHRPRCPRQCQVGFRNSNETPTATRKRFEPQARPNTVPAPICSLTCSDNSQENGTVVALSEQVLQPSPTLTSNAVESHLYTDVAQVHKSKDYIGQGTAPRRHIHIF